MDEQAQHLVLENIRSQINQSWRKIVAELRAYGDYDLPSFLHESGLELADLLRRGTRSWTELRREAGLSTRSGGALEEGLLKRVRALSHVDDPSRAGVYRLLLSDDPPRYTHLDETEQRFARMLFFALWPNGGGFASYEEGLGHLSDEAAARDELTAVVDLAFDQARHATAPLAGALRPLPLRVHGRYQREEILAALDYAHLQRTPKSFQAGVMWSEPWRSDAFLVTLRKAESDYSPTTMYRDYAISPTLFHWESQSTTSLASATGQRYLQHGLRGSNILLFTRDHRVDDLGTAPYLFLGPARYVSHVGDRPIAITWELAHAMPADTFTTASVAAG